MNRVTPAFTRLAAVFPVFTIAMAPLSVPAAESQPAKPAPSGWLSVADFLPDGAVTDGSVSYQPAIQRAIDAAAAGGGVVVFPPMVYGVDETGLRLRSGVTLHMEGAVFRLVKTPEGDGAIFSGNDVHRVTLIGGRFAGDNAAWPDGANIRGVHITGDSRHIRIRDSWIHGLSSNGIGMFGNESQPIRDVWITDVVVENCCNRYPDYLSGEKWEKGSAREDQGLVAFYYVEDFTVRGCRLEGSRSDGTHFYRCRRGQFVANRVYDAKMGGYFVEGGEQIVADGNLIRSNGSRGATIERGATNCVFSNNVVATSGREGLWAPDCTGCLVQGNVFDRNGRKPNGPERRHIWNANITINTVAGDPTDSPTRDYLVSDNVIFTGDGQIAAIRVDADHQTAGIVIRDNVLRGENRRILVEGPRGPEVIACDNQGAKDPTDE